jgi:hypothetical protein
MSWAKSTTRYLEECVRGGSYSHLPPATTTSSTAGGGGISNLGQHLMPDRHGEGAASQDVWHSHLRLGSMWGAATLIVQAAQPSSTCQGKQARWRTSPWVVPKTSSSTSRSLRQATPRREHCSKTWRSTGRQSSNPKSSYMAPSRVEHRASWSKVGDTARGQEAQGPCDVGDPAALNQCLMNYTSLPRLSQDEREQVWSYVLYRLSIEPPILPE